LKGKPVCFLESTLVAGSDTDHAAQARSSQVIDVLNRLKSPDFILEFQVEKASASQPSASRMRSFLEKRLRALDYDAIVAGGPDSPPRWVWSELGWKVTFFPIPKKRAARNGNG
jgi:hypothetical protein